MKRHIALRSLLCFLLCAVMLVVPFTALAAGQATAGISARVYDSEQKKIVSANQFTAGQMFYVCVSIQGNEVAGGLSFDLKYDNQLLKFMPGSSINLITDNPDSLSAFTTETGATVMWEENAKRSLDGDIYFAAFKAEGLTESTSTTVSLTVTQLFNNDMENISVNYNTSQVTIQLVTNTLSAAELELFQKLKTIVYPDSLKDIEAAEVAFAALGSTKQQLLKKFYPEIYQDYASARDRYNRLVDEAAEQAVLDELEAFTNAHGAVLALTPETVKSSDRDAVTAAQNALKNADNALSQRAQALLNKAYGELLTSLDDALFELEDIEKQIALFKETYGKLFFLDEAEVNLALEHYRDELKSAIDTYDGSPDALKNTLKAEYDSMVQMYAYSIEQIALQEASSELAKEISAYQAQWLNVLLLNTATVSVGDETAINMALTAYNTLSEEAKANLEPKMQTLQSLLKLIEGMKEGKPNENPGNTGPAETVPVETQTVVVEKDRPINTLVYMTKTSPVFLTIAIILLVLAVIALVLPFVLGIIRKKHKREPVKEGSK